uniref:FLYWCH-type domain-containing protein n=1 Tax=Strongyloides papillosus TaxID=174720 RepID=A0A0N5BU79_STREA
MSLDDMSYNGTVDKATNDVTNAILRFLSQPLSAEDTSFSLFNGSFDFPNNITSSSESSVVDGFPSHKKYKTLKTFSTFNEGEEYVKSLKILRCKSQYPGRALKTFQYACKIKDCKYYALLRTEKDGRTAILQVNNEFHSHTIKDLEEQQVNPKKPKLDMCEKALEVAMSLKKSGMSIKDIHKKLEEDAKSGVLSFRGDEMQLKHKLYKQSLKDSSSSISNNINIVENIFGKSSYDITVEEYAHDPCVKVFHTWEEGQEYIKNLKILRCKSTYPKRIVRKTHQFVCRIRDCNYSAMLKMTGRDSVSILRGNYPTHDHTADNVEEHNMIKKRKIDICPKALEIASTMKKAGFKLCDIESKLKAEDEKGNVIFKSGIHQLRNKLYKNGKNEIERSSDTFIDLIRTFNPSIPSSEKESSVISNNGSISVDENQQNNFDELIFNNSNCMDVSGDKLFSTSELDSICSGNSLIKVFDTWEKGEKYVQDLKVFRRRSTYPSSTRKSYQYVCKIEDCKYSLILKSAKEGNNCILKANSLTHEHNADNMNDYLPMKKKAFELSDKGLEIAIELKRNGLQYSEIHEFLENEAKKGKIVYRGDCKMLRSRLSRMKDKVKTEAGNDNGPVSLESITSQLFNNELLKLSNTENNSKMEVDECHPPIKNETTESIVNLLSNFQACISSKENSSPGCSKSDNTYHDNTSLLNESNNSKISFEHVKVFDSWEQGEEYIKSMKILRCKSKYPKRQRRSHQYVCRMRDCRFSIMLKMSENEKCILRANSVNHEHTDEDLKSINSIKVRKLEICDKAFEMAKKYRLDGMSVKEIHKVLEHEKQMNPSICYNLNEGQLRNKFNTAGLLKEHSKEPFNTLSFFGDALSLFQNINSQSNSLPLSLNGSESQQKEAMCIDSNNHETPQIDQLDFSKLIGSLFNLNPPASAI